MKRTYTQMVEINSLKETCDNWNKTPKSSFKFDTLAIKTLKQNTPMVSYDMNNSFTNETLQLNTNFTIPSFTSSSPTITSNKKNNNQMFTSIDDAMSYYDKQLNNTNNSDEMNIFSDNFNNLYDVKFCDEIDDKKNPYT
eukprot:267565_1